jgi:hypothetical protein
MNASFLSVITRHNIDQHLSINYRVESPKLLSGLIIISLFLQSNKTLGFPFILYASTKCKCTDIQRRHQNSLIDQGPLNKCLEYDIGTCHNYHVLVEDRALRAINPNLQSCVVTT